MASAQGLKYRSCAGARPFQHALVGNVDGAEQVARRQAIALDAIALDFPQQALAVGHLAAGKGSAAEQQQAEREDDQRVAQKLTKPKVGGSGRAHDRILGLNVRVREG